MGLNMAITVICTMDHAYVNKGQNLEQSKLLEYRYLVPQHQIYEAYCGPEAAFTVESENVILQGYQVFYCLNYVFDA